MMGSLCVCPWRRCGALANRTALWARREPELAKRETSASSSSCSSLEKNTGAPKMFFNWLHTWRHVFGGSELSLIKTNYLWLGERYKMFFLLKWRNKTKKPRGHLRKPTAFDSFTRWDPKMNPMAYILDCRGTRASVLRRSISCSPSLSLALPRWLIWVTQSASGPFKRCYVQ